MGRILERSAMKRTPKVKFTIRGVPDVNGTWFVGTLAKKRTFDARGGAKTTVFEFVLKDAHESLRVVTGNEKDGYVDAEVGPGSEVCLVGGYSESTGEPNQLTDKLLQGVEGNDYRVTFVGKKVSQSSGRTFNDYLVEEL